MRPVSEGVACHVLSRSVDRHALQVHSSFFVTMQAYYTPTKPRLASFEV